MGHELNKVTDLVFAQNLTGVLLGILKQIYRHSVKNKDQVRTQVVLLPCSFEV